MNVDHLVRSYGYSAVFVLVALESLGIPLPGETIVILAGSYAGNTHKLSVWGVFAAAAVGALVGDNAGYWIGDKGGYRLLRRFGRYIRVDESKLKVGRYIFARHGGKVVFFGRFVSVLRTYAAFLAGTNRMGWRRFLVFNAAGGVVWAAVYAFGSYEAGSTVRRLRGIVDVAVAAVAVLIVAAVVVITHRQAGRLVERAEAAYPGPLDEERPRDR